MKVKFGSTFGLVKKTAIEWNDDNCSTLAAAMSYYTIFSLAPVIIIAVAVAGLLFGSKAAQGQIQEQIQGLVGESGAKVIESMVVSANKPSTGIIATVLSVLLLAFAASGVFVQLQQSLNVIWKAKAPPKMSGVVNLIRTRFLSLAMVLGIGFLLLVSLVLSAGLAAAGSFLNNLVPGWAILWQVVNLVVSFGVVTLLFGMIYKILPDAAVRWSDVWLGAAVTSLLFSLGKFGIGLYLGKGSVASTYGAAGSLAVVLLWVYYSAQILFFGAEFTQVYSKSHGSQGPGKLSEVPGTAGAKAFTEVPASTWLPS